MQADAIHIVRTVGQAFDVCHRISLSQAAQNQETTEAETEKTGIKKQKRKEKCRSCLNTEGQCGQYVWGLFVYAS